MSGGIQQLYKIIFILFILLGASYEFATAQLEYPSVSPNLSRRSIRTATARGFFTEFGAKSPGRFAFTIMRRETSRAAWRNVGKWKTQRRGFFI